ncbi:B3 domain-containing transcription factor VRN1-like [Rutidosis leptorrhynchoides]|uniref:B3 domain-containing transcription factor VRN1-like n=1 Tax=Rutidosis leptorrhynchoides TaxID=125765 RepID=UPI003A9A0701
MTLDGRLFMELETPHFLKIILHDTVNQRKIMIPVMFVRKYGSDLSSPVVLKVPTGAEWKVGFEKSDHGEIWLQSGFFEFMEHYSIVYGHLLVFKYDGNSKFSITIYDSTATEIEYT